MSSSKPAACRGLLGGVEVTSLDRGADQQGGRQRHAQIDVVRGEQP
jgi:hypothetical protein